MKERVRQVVRGIGHAHVVAVFGSSLLAASLSRVAPVSLRTQAGIVIIITIIIIITSINVIYIYIYRERESPSDGQRQQNARGGALDSRSLDQLVGAIDDRDGLDDVTLLV